MKVSFEKLKIRTLGPLGDGVATSPKGNIFVEGALPYEVVEAKVFRDKQGVWRGDIQQILEPSRDRVSPSCPHFEKCGGCTLQHLKLNAYQAWKVQTVKDLFSKQGLKPLEWLPPVFLKGGNRRRATFSAVKTRGGVILGYYERRSKHLIPIETCEVLSPEIFQLAEGLKKHLSKLLIEGRPTDFFFQGVNGKQELIITGELTNSAKPVVEKLYRELKLSRLGWRKTSMEKIEILFHASPLIATFGSLEISLPPMAFLQPTLEGEAALVKAVIEALPSSGYFADLFSGVGTFSGPLSAHGKVDCFEIEGEACKALSKAHFLKVSKRNLYLKPLTAKELSRYDAVVFDPPRAGCEEQAYEMARAKTGVLIAVSCNPATLARDARILVEGGYWLRSLKVVDQFLWSHHVEVVAVFTRKKR